MIFQLANHNTILQEFVCQSSKTTLRSQLRTATELLGSLIKAAGTVHVVVDGLDEIDEKERRRLLVELLSVKERCPEARLLISRRSEHYIEALLKPESAVIQVDACNSRGIQQYVKSGYLEWARLRRFDHHGQAEVALLLDPVAEKAQGWPPDAHVDATLALTLSNLLWYRNVLVCPDHPQGSRRARYNR